MIQMRHVLTIPVFLIAILAALSICIVAGGALVLRDMKSETTGSLTREPLLQWNVTVIDGDTFEATIMLWPDLSVRTKIRLEGADAPELRARCSAERLKAQEAKDAMAFLLDGRAVLSAVRRDKYGGRFLARVTLADGSDLATTLIAAGFAREYHGGKRRSWC
jgi:micrococcal nuclease